MNQDYTNEIAQFNPMLNPALRNNILPPQVQTVPQAAGPAPTQSANGLLPMLMQKMMGQAPSQLLQKQQAFQQQMQQMMQDHQMRLLESNYKLYNDFLNNDQARKIADEYHVPVASLAQSTLPAETLKNAVAYEQIKGNAMKQPGFQEATNRGMNAAAERPDVLNRKELTTQTPMNTITTVPGQGLQGNQVIQGPLSTQGLAQGIGGMLYPYTNTKPGQVTNSMPVDPLKAQQAIDAVRGTLGGGLPSSYHNMFGGDQGQQSSGFGANALSTTPQPNNGSQGIQTTPPNNSGPSPLTPQWPPRSGAIPGGYDVMGGGISNLFNLYKSNVSDPLWRLLMGQ